MIVREIANPEYTDIVLNSFDYFNDYKDTRYWCLDNAPHLVKRLDAGMSEYTKKWSKRNFTPLSKTVKGKINPFL